MSYQGQDVFGYKPYETVDEVADYTDMMGQASEMNHGAASKNSWMRSPTKSLLCAWFAVVIVYFILTFFFRRYVV